MKNTESPEYTTKNTEEKMAFPQELSEKWTSFFGNFRLQTVLTFSIVLIFILAIGVTSLFSYYNSQYTVSELAGKLQQSVTDRIDQHLDSYLDNPHLINTLCLDSIRNGELDIRDPDALKRHFQDLTYRFNTSESICFAHEEDGNYTIVSSVGGPGIASGTERFWAYSGIYTNYTLFEYRIDKEGYTLEKTLSIPNYDPRNRPWYTSAVKAKGPAWSEIYMWLEGVVSLDATTPVYSEHNELLGVLDTSLTLTGIGEFLQKLKISEHGQAFIIDKSGMLVASSTIKEPYQRMNDKLVRLSALNCSDPIIEGTTCFLQEYPGIGFNVTQRQLYKAKIGADQQFIQITPYHDQYGLDWLIIVLIPESDIMGNIDRNTQETFFLILLSIIITIIICVLLARWITNPILSMNKSAKALASGNWSSWKELDRHDELGELSHSFKEMADQLQSSFSSLKDSEEQYMSLFQSSADAILLFDGFSLVKINHAGEVMFSLSDKEYVGKTIPELFGDVGDGITRLIETHVSIQNQGYLEDTITRNLNGEERFINIRLTWVPGDENVLNLVYLRDITDQRRAIITFAEQEALRESFSQIQMILQFLPDPTYVIDTQGHVLFWNPAIEELTGIKSEEMIHSDSFCTHQKIIKYGKPGLITLALHPKKPWEEFYPYLEHTGEIIRSSFWVEIQGEMKYLSAIAARLYDKNGQVAGAIESIRDITLHKANEEALLIANRKLNLLSSVTRHDIQNKVMIAKSYLFLIGELNLTQDMKEAVTVIDRSMNAIEHFIAFTRTYQELGIRVPAWQNVREVFDQAAEEVDSGDIVIHNDVKNYSILADPLFNKVGYNLIENAIRHGENLTRIEITAHETDLGLRISIADNGVGVPDDLKEMIFERGYGKNTGFGLFLVREILSISEITIREQGQAGVGCIFHIDVPAGKFRNMKNSNN